MDRAPAQEDALAPARHRAHHDLRVVVEHVTAIGADHALAIVALRNGPDRRPADGTGVTHPRKWWAKTIRELWAGSRARTMWAGLTRHLQNRSPGESRGLPS